MSHFLPESFSETARTEDHLPPALSDEYSDIIVRYPTAPGVSQEEIASYFPQPVNGQYSILYAPLSAGLSTVEEIGYAAVPKLYTAVDEVSLEVSGILAVQTQPFLRLGGAGVLIGFLDTGIDYTHPAFRGEDGRTRIVRLWDQSDTRGTPPDGISYGSEYTEEDINRALFSGTAARDSDTAVPDRQAATARSGAAGSETLAAAAGSGAAKSESLAAAAGSGAAGSESLAAAGSGSAPGSPVPARDPDGHGTAVAGIACGSAEPESDFTGAAPESSIAFVRLKPAKQYLRDYFRIPKDALAWQEDDLMVGVRYLLDTARKLDMPLVICISAGTNQGAHTGSTPFEEVLTSASFSTGVCVAAGTGNETGRGHHFYGQLKKAGDYTDVELLADQETEGFTVEFWADAPELFRIGFTSPLGEVIESVPPQNGTTREFSFLFERSRISVTFTIVEMLSGSQLALIRFTDPVPGLWRIRVESRTFISGAFHLWLPVSGLVGSMIRFYSPDAYTTLVIPSCAQSVLSVANWNAYSNSLSVNSGRGYTRNGLIKPDFASPGADVSCPAPGGGYTTLSGSCAASAMAAGAAALLFESGLRQQPPRYFTAAEIKSLFLRGARRSSALSYPNREWGYGSMDVYGIFEAYRQG